MNGLRKQQRTVSCNPSLTQLNSLFATCRLHLQNCRAFVFNCGKQRENSTMEVHCNETINIKKHDAKVFSILYVAFMLLLLCLRYEQTNNIKINITIGCKK